jgi:glycosyltransferase involved in cell wall biosynthesis
VPVRNEAKALPACLRPLRGFQHVVVVDSSSTDDTAEVARKYGAEVINFLWDGKFPKKRNWVLRHYRFKTPWVLFLDADEVVSEEFCREVAKQLESSEHSGFWLNYTNWFLGCRLWHGERNRKLALLRIGKGEYERIPEESWSPLDMEIHEHPIVDGAVGEILSPIDHRDDRGYSRWLIRHEAYSTWEANRIRVLREQAVAGSAAPLTWRQRVKYGLAGSVLLPAIYFIWAYVLRLGFLDGYAGFVHAMSKAIYFWQIGVKLHEAESRPPRSPGVLQG